MGLSQNNETIFKVQLLFEVEDGAVDPEKDRAGESEPLSDRRARDKKKNSLRESEDFDEEVGHLLFVFKEEREEEYTKRHTPVCTRSLV